MGPVGGIPMTAPKDVGRCKTWLKTTKAGRGGAMFFTGARWLTSGVSLGKKGHFWEERNCQDHMDSFILYKSGSTMDTLSTRILRSSQWQG